MISDPVGVTGLPHYEHDCTGCRFIGNHDHDGYSYDLYYCPIALGGPTIVARWSSDGPDYTSGVCFGKYDNGDEEEARRMIIGPPPDRDAPLAVAYRRVVAFGWPLGRF